MSASKSWSLLRHYNRALSPAGRSSRPLIAQLSPSPSEAPRLGAQDPDKRSSRFLSFSDLSAVALPSIGKLLPSWGTKEKSVEKEGLKDKAEETLPPVHQIKKAEDQSKPGKDPIVCQKFDAVLQEQQRTVTDYISSAPPSQGRDSSTSVLRSEGEEKSIAGTVTGALPAAARLVKGLFASEQDATTKEEGERREAAKKKEEKWLLEKDHVSRAAVDGRTRALCHGVRAASSNMSRRLRVEELCRHVLEYPDTRTVVWQEKLVPVLHGFRQSADRALRDQCLEALALVGQVDPVKGPGINILAIDGGGSRGIVALETLQRLESQLQKPLHQVFDLVCGVSTGAMVAALVFVFRVPVQECVELYKEYTRQMFSRNAIVGTSKLVWAQAYYDAQIWEDILRKNFGEKSLLSTAKDCPKMSVVTCAMNTAQMNNYLFRNYNLHPSRPSQYEGTCSGKLWQAIRASSAAPGYYEEFRHGDYILQDGGLMTNNPAAVAIHEARLLWPTEKLHTVVSLGTGKYEPICSLTDKVTVKEKVIKIIDSTTGTDGVHQMLQDLLPPSVYFRLNPYLSENLLLDEIRPDKIEAIQYDAQMYLRRNQLKLEKGVSRLKQRRGLLQKGTDAIKKKLRVL